MGNGFAYVSVLMAGMASAAPAAFWQFEGGPPGAAADAVTPAGRGGVFGNGEGPVFADDVPFKALWDGPGDKPVVPDNRASLRFRVPDEVKGAAPVGGEIAVPGQDAALKPGSFTVEAFVKIAKLTGRHALVASKRRNGQSGASWSLSVTPQGTLGARFDTEREKDGKREGVFNQCFGGARMPDDGDWHHVALSFDGATCTAALFVDYQACGGGTAAAAVIYDDSPLVIGRGLDGWLDEVRLTPAALHPEQFLRPPRFFSEMTPKKAPAQALLDQTQTRVQSALKPDLVKLGTLRTKSVVEIETPMWSLGCETLDRNLADWDAYRNYLVPLGIRRIRLQGGWNRTEKKKGEYDFEWLDHIVDDALKLGLEVCLETSYNNRLYEPGGATGPGGLLPAGEETLAAWDRWVEAMVKRYSAKGVHEWMTYNEPNLRKENTPELIVANNVRTAEIIKRIDPSARIGAFVLAGLNVEMMRTMLGMIGKQGKLGLFTWAIYHGYSGNPDRLNARMAEFKAMLAEVAPNIRPWQGEAGCASEEVQYALSGIDWTEYSHAKWNARRMLCDFGCGVDSSVFCISDVSYSKDFISRYGLLKTNPDNSIIKVKTAYYAVQNVLALFNGACERMTNDAVTVTGLGADQTLSQFHFRDRKGGGDIVALWNATDIPGNGSEIQTVCVRVRGGQIAEPVWVDLITGGVYEIPAEHVTSADGDVTVADVPVYDGPGAILDKRLVSYEPVKVAAKRARKKSAGGKAAPAAKAGLAPVRACLLPGTQQPAPAVLVCAASAEAEQVSKRLNAQEIHAFVLAEGASAGQAVSYIRAHAAEWQVKPDAVGVLGVGESGARAAAEGAASADFSVFLDVPREEALANVPEPKRESAFVGARGACERELAGWLEKRKGRVF